MAPKHATGGSEAIYRRSQSMAPTRNTGGPQWGEYSTTSRGRSLGARGCARPGQDDPRNYAASEILDEYLDANFAAISYRDGDSISIAGPDRLAAQLNLPLEHLTAYLESLPEDGDEGESSRSLISLPVFVERH